VNARNSSRATSLKSFSKSLPDPPCTNSRNSPIVFPGATCVSIVARMTFSAHATVCAWDWTRILLIMA
jgi:hypothetical protein